MEYVASWVTTDHAHCYQVMRAAEPRLLEQWIAQWRDLVDFEVIPVITSAEAAAAITPAR